MAAGVAPNVLSLADAGARLRINRINEQRLRRSHPKDLLSLSRARTNAMGTSRISADPSAVRAPNTDQASAGPQSEAGEIYQRAFRQRQLQHQIGESVGVVLNRQYSDDVSQDVSTLDAIEQDYAQREAELLMNNQLGLDQRSAGAKRATQAALRQSGLEEGLKHLSDEFQKELSAFAVNAGAGAAEVIDSFCEDAGITEGLVFIQNQAQAVRTILSPEPPKASENPTSIQELKAKLTESFLDTIIPRFNLYTLSGLTGLIKAIAQWFVIAFILVILLLIIIIQVSIIYGLHNPLTAILGGLRFITGF